MFKGKVNITADYFDNYRYNQLISQNATPLFIGQSVPQRNNGESVNRGFEVMVSYKGGHKNGLNYAITGTFSYAKNKILYISEAPDYPYLAQTGRQIGMDILYKWAGYYQANDFDESGNVKAGIPAPTWSKVQPGDMKYVDLNNDGFITNADRTFASKPNLPTSTYGLNLGLSYKGLSFSALVQGAYDYTVRVIGEGSDAFYGNIVPWHLQRWTSSTSETATFPRIGLNASVNNSSFTTASDFWNADASYIRLRSVEIAFQLPSKFFNNSIVKSTRFYISGYNLLNVNNMSKFQQDAEVSNGYGNAYPNTRNFNLGVQVGF